MNDEYKPRFSFEITEEQKQQADRLISVHGLRKAIFSVILNDVLELIEKNGEVVIGVILSGAAKPREILPMLAKAERMGKDG